MPGSDKWLSIELAIELARARVQVSFVPLRLYTRDLGAPQAAAPVHAAGVSEPDPPTFRLLRSVHGLTAALSRVLPWKCTCLVRALAAHRVLRRRGCLTRLSLGVRKNVAEMEAHAWLSYGSRIITGAAQAASFSPVATFENTQTGAATTVSRSPSSI